MTRTRVSEVFAEGFLLASSSLFLGWYIWAKLSHLPAGTWHGY